MFSQNGSAALYDPSELAQSLKNLLLDNSDNDDDDKCDDNDNDDDDNLSQSDDKTHMDYCDIQMQFEKGRALMFGYCDIEKDIDEAYEELEEVADCGHVESMYLLYHLLSKEMKKEKEGFKYCLKAAEKGHNKAQFQLADLCAFGQCCDRDEEKARRMAKMAMLANKQSRNSKNNYNIEEIIKLGKLVCEFEVSAGLSKDRVTLDERISRFVAKNSQIFKDNGVSQIFQNNFQHIINPPYVDHSIVGYFHTISDCDYYKMHMPMLLEYSRHGN